MENNRREFLSNSAIGLFGALPLIGHLGFGNIPSVNSTVGIIQDTKGINPLYPITDPDVIRQVVGASHVNFDKVKEMVTARPELAKATQDWGFGDVETALGAASHMGRKDIADILMEHGARPDIFTYAMLGKLNTVKAIIEDMPGAQLNWGPHGFTLMHHAQIRLKRKNVEGAEKEEQEALVEYLTSLGDADVKAPSLDITAEERKIYLGTYIFGDGEDEFFKVEVNGMDRLSIARGEYFGRSLLRVGEHTFAPGGAPSVRVVFEVVDGMSRSVEIHDPGVVLRASYK